MNTPHIMAKPTGSKCNIDCEYCFYLEKEKLYPDRSDWRMSDDVLDTYIRKTIDSQKAMPHCEFSWQGGEPTLMGIDFFEKAIALQKKYAGSKHCQNSFQTNGILIDEKWCTLFKNHNFLIGLSIDGEAKHHDIYRKTRSGKGTHYRVTQTLSLFRKHGVEFNAMTVIHKGNVNDPKGVYKALKSYGCRHIQLTPLIERKAQETTEDGLMLINPDFSGQSKVTEWSITAEEYGSFMCGIFDQWKKKDVGKTFIYTFESTLAQMAGTGGASCITRETCGDAIALEANGDIYSCDHYVYPEHLVGNILTHDIDEIAKLDSQINFGNAKRDNISIDCKSCKYLRLCNGGCPKHRFEISSDGKPNKNYLCSGYKRYFAHTSIEFTNILSAIGKR